MSENNNNNEKSQFNTLVWGSLTLTPINVMVSSSLSSQTIFHPLLKWEMVGLINIMFLAEDKPIHFTDKGLLKSWLWSIILLPLKQFLNRTIIAVKHSSSITAPAKGSWYNNVQNMSWSTASFTTTETYKTKPTVCHTFPFPDKNNVTNALRTYY